MKKIITFCLIGLFTCGTLSVSAQSKEDLLEALELILDLPETEALFQHHLSEGETLLILKPDTRRLGDKNYLENIFFELTDDDFRYFSRPVKVITTNEARAQDIGDQYLARIGCQFESNQIRFSITSTLREELLFYSGNFSVIRETADDDWEVNSQQFQTQKTR